MGYAFTLDKLVNTTGSGLCFRPLHPKLELGMYLVWKKSQIFSRGYGAVSGTAPRKSDCLL